MYAETSARHHSETRAAAGSIHWFDRHQRPRQRPPRSLLPWLLAEDSLTRYLIRASAGDFRVERIIQRWQRPTLSEARLLGVDPQHRALIREVILWGCGEPWVYARSVIPAASLQGELRRLRRLRNASLGAQLFRYPQLQRTPFEIARIEPAALPPRLQQTGCVWARRSRFRIRHQQLIVGEIFLEAFTRSTAALRHAPVSNHRLR